MKLEKLFVPYDLGVKILEKGFDEEFVSHMVYIEKLPKKPDPPTITYANLFFAPMYQQVIDWFREKHKLVIDVGLSGDEECKFAGRIYDSFFPHMTKGRTGESDYYDTLEKIIYEALKLI